MPATYNRDKIEAQNKAPSRANSDKISLTNNDQEDDLDSEPSINLRRKFKGILLLI